MINGGLGVLGTSGVEGPTLRCQESVDTSTLWASEELLGWCYVAGAWWI